MNKKEKHMPMLGRCIGLCFASFVFSVTALIIAIQQESKDSLNIGVLFSIIWFVVGLILLIFSIFSWNSPVYFDEEKMSQKRFGKEHVLYYKDIERIGQKLRLFSKLPVPIKIYGKGKTFCIDIGSLCYRTFKEKVENYPISKTLDEIENHV